MIKISKENFEIESRKIHGNKYNYSKVEYINTTTKVCIICPEHGEFWQTPKAHIRQKYGCFKCAVNKRANNKKKNTNEFINKAVKIHNNKYDYSKVEYTLSSNKVCIICPEHGEFWQVANEHLKGHGCPKCGFNNISIKTRLNTNEFITKAKLIHGNKYDYSKVEYVTNNKIVTIICPEHGEFKQTPNSHLNGSGCPKCGNEKISESKLLSQKTFISKCEIVHNKRYDYSKIKYNGYKSQINIICPIHGEFKQLASDHINGHGCPLCGFESSKKNKLLTTNEFIAKAKLIHGNKYDYSKVEYINSKEYVTIICPEHGEFKQTPDKHLQGQGCLKCSNHISKSENEILLFCQKVLNENKINHNDRNIISPYEIDIYIPSIKIGIEYNGLRWHSEIFGRDKKYHLNKLNLCKKQGVKLIQIFEDEYLNHKDIVYSKLNHLLGVNTQLPKIYARKCNISVIDKKTTELFLDKYHIQGFSSSSIYLGAYYNDELIGVMTFKKERKNNNNWELTRFATNYHYICCGVGGKLFNYFVKNYNPDLVKSFADRRWTINEDNNLYIKLGFKFGGYTSPDYHYFKPSDGLIRQHKFGFRKGILNKKYDLPLSMTENEMTNELGYTKIYDCGLIKYVYKKTE